MLDNASKEQLAEFISSLHGHVASLLRHMVGSVGFRVTKRTQKQILISSAIAVEFNNIATSATAVDFILPLSFDKAGGLFDFGHPLLNRIAGSFITATGIGEIQAVSREACYIALENDEKEEEKTKWNEKVEGLVVVVGESERRRGVAEEVAKPPGKEMDVAGRINPDGEPISVLSHIHTRTGFPEREMGKKKRVGEEVGKE
ncbi:hypothetical protein L2E82_23055 [Cichorium intybus]|uniref:Uncharacterized protein n=1 Tax=Cichorium intybus TaxID=13427 RepID=A0ACB9E0H6_CICIN|nr:hypothetical protein L2E82_23055 [Cichorium intybus]